MPPSKLTIGDKVPRLTLLDQDGAMISLKNFEGKQPMVLIFYPGDLTPGCTIQLCSVRDEWKSFEEKNIAVFGVNPASNISHKAFKDKHQFPFPLLIDTDKTLAERFGAIFSFFGVKIIRRTVVGIDKTGTIRYIKQGMPATRDILKAMTHFI